MNIIEETIINKLFMNIVTKGEYQKEFDELKC